MAEQEQPTPEEVNVYNRALIRDLRLLYTSGDETPSLDRVRDRLRAVQPGQTPYPIDTLEKSGVPLQRKQLQQVHSIAVPALHRRTARSYLGTLAAVLVLALIAGTVLLMTHVSQKRISSTTIATSTASDTSAFGNGWKVVAAYAGTGSKTISNQHLVFNHVLGVWITCSGKGTTDIVFNNAQGEKYHTSCHGEANNRLSSVLQASVPYSVDSMHITVDKDSSWQLQLVSCLNITATSACGIPFPARTAT